MTLDVRFGYPLPWLRLARLRLERSLGAIMVGASLAASIAAIVLLFVVLVVLVGDIEGPDRSALIMWLVVSVIVFGLGGSVGLRMVRRGRSIVLLLRRFADPEAIDAFTHAATGAVGASWRIVTLDDSSVRPVDPAAAPTRAARAVSSTASAVATTLMHRFPRVLQTVFVLLVIAGLWAYSATDDIYSLFEPLEPILSLRIPSQAFGLDPIGLFAVLATLIVLLLVAGAVLALLMILGIPLGAVLAFTGRVDEASTESAADVVQRVFSGPDIERAIANIQERASRVVSPRLFILRVTNPMWQETVERFIEIAHAVMVDVSEPSVNVLWELEQVMEDRSSAMILTCDRAQVLEVEQAIAADEFPGFGTLLDGKLILGYDSNRRGLRRFSRALRNRLLTVER